jgi:hypothetical protein
MPTKTLGGKEERKKKDDSDTESLQPRIFVFMIGGLSHHEIVSIANLQE